MSEISEPTFASFTQKLASLEPTEKTVIVELCKSLAKKNKKELELKERELKVEERERTVEEWQRKVEERKCKVKERKHEVEERERKVEEREHEVEERERKGEERKYEVEERERKVEKRERKVDERERKMEERENEMEKLKLQNDELSSQLEILHDIKHFDSLLDNERRRQLFSLLYQYRPPTKKQRKARLRACTMTRGADGKDDDPAKATLTLEHELTTVEELIAYKEAMYVVFASDPPSRFLLSYLPARCRRMGVPYCIVKNKSLLGSVVGKEEAACIAITSVQPKDRGAWDEIFKTKKSNFSFRPGEIRKRQGSFHKPDQPLAKIIKVENAEVNEEAN